MKHPANWTRSDLHEHLQHALNLELWTIPLYLTALYSIKGLKKLEHKDYPDAAKLILSVVVQEMLHMELVCNICNAMGFAPQFRPTNYNEEKGIPFIHPAKDCIPADLVGYTVKPQALNKQSLRLFCAIELPHPKRDITWEEEKSYGCIADLYYAIKLGISHFWNECYIGDEHNTKQKNNFNEYYNSGGKKHGFSQKVYSPETAAKAIDAIVEQGEGADTRHVPADFRPHQPEEGKEFETAWYKGNLSHYQKFRILLHSYHKLPPVYEEHYQERLNTTQRKMRTSFLDFLAETQHNFNSDGEGMPDSFWNNMSTLGDVITDVWESGLCPDFNFDV